MRFTHTHSTPKLVMRESYDDGYNYNEEDWVKVASKPVYDDDGFVDEYTWYKSKDGKLHIFMRGDSDIYTPDRDYADWETESEKEASDWFDSYDDAEGHLDFDVTENFENMATWALDYTVDGTRSSQTVKAQSAVAAQDLVRKQYGGQTVTFVKTKKMEESLKEDDEDEVVADDDISIASVVADKLANGGDISIEVDDNPEAPVPPAQPVEGEESPATPMDSGIAMMINSLIQDEWQAIDGYTSAIRTLQEQNAHPEMIATLEDIMKEENTHVGQLQLLMGIIAPTTDAIDKGEEEASHQVEDSQPVEQVMPVVTTPEFKTPEAPTAAQNLADIASEVVTVADDII